MHVAVRGAARALEEVEADANTDAVALRLTCASIPLQNWSDSSHAVVRLGGHTHTHSFD